jgi:TPR repeat protein
MLGTIYYEGRGVTQDFAEAMKWFWLAAAQGQAEAQLNLGSMYGRGQGDPKDYAQAHMWSNLAASRWARSIRAGTI